VNNLPLTQTQVVVLMGVAGSGKTTVGLKLAAALGWGFRDADEFHPAANVAKMSAGIPLTDADRVPWLEAIRAYIGDCLAGGEHAVVTCSALRESYRERIMVDPARVALVYLRGDFSLILERMQRREGHFMKETMLRSQFDTLEAPLNAIVVDVAQSPEQIVAEIRKKLGQ